MSLLKPAVNTTAYMKVGILGFPGSGKTYTATELALGLAKLEKGKQIAFFDTEKGSDFMIEKAKKAGIEILRHKGRAFVDLITIIGDCEKQKIPVLVIDSITHVWQDITESYKQKAKKKMLTMYDWGILKSQWHEYADRYVNSSVHIIMCGRAGYEYDQEVNEDSGKKEIVKTGTKMKVEGDTGYEPDLLLEMIRVEELDKITNRCWVKKDRSALLNGKYFDFPTFKTFEPFIRYLNIGGQHEGVDVSRTSADAFDSPDWSVEEKKKRREIAIETLKGLFIKADIDGSSDRAKKARVKAFEDVFNGQFSATYIENLPLLKLEEGVKKMRTHLKLDTDVPLTAEEEKAQREFDDAVANTF